jgi:hypothetical protein
MEVYCTAALLYRPVKHGWPGKRHHTTEVRLTSRTSGQLIGPARRPVDGGGDDEIRRRRLARELAELMRPDLPALVNRIVQEVQHDVPVYARPGDGPYGRVTRKSVACAVAAFVDLVEDPSAARDTLVQTCRRLGSGEAHEGRTLDDLHAAYRVGMRVGWQWIMRLGQRRRLSSTVVARLAEMLFDYGDELARMSSRGYREAQAEIKDARAGLRRRLMRLILEQPAVHIAVITDLAHALSWPVADTVVAVSVEAGARLTRTPNPLWGNDILAELESPQPHLLLPEPADSRRLLKIASDLGARIVVGPPTPLAEAVHSLRWARAAQRLVAAGTLPDIPVTWCSDHLTTLWLVSDEHLVDQLARQQLEPLSEFPVGARPRLAETLRSWLGNGGKIDTIAAELAVHPQTVRYRLRQLEQAFGDRLYDSDARFAMEVALRATALRR